MNSSKYLLLLIGSTAASFVGAQCNVETISKKLVLVKINSQFSQSKNIATLSKPLKSKGVIWMSNQKTLVWQVNKPIKSTLVIDQRGMRQFNRKDQLQDSNQQMVPASMTTLFFNIASGNFVELEKSFEMKVNCEQEKWQVNLIPKEKDLKSILKQLSIKGSTSISGFSYTEIRGDMTQVELVDSPVSLELQLNQYLN